MMSHLCFFACPEQPNTAVSILTAVDLYLAKVVLYIDFLNELDSLSKSVRVHLTTTLTCKSGTAR